MHTFRRVLKLKKRHSTLLESVFQGLIVVFFLLVVSSIHAQDTLKPKRVVVNESDFDSKITYSAKDSMYADFKKKQLHLFGDAHFTYDGIDMRSGYILIDLGKKEMLATYSLDTNNQRVGEPIFTENGDTMRAGSIRYNFDTKKGYIQEVALKQQEYYLSMEVAKRQANDQIHFVKGKFTTCDLEDPHYHFFLSKAILIPEKRIVTGPMNLWIMGVPTPIGLPFAVLPQQKEREKPNGLVMPQISVISAYGMGFQDLGYYHPINEKVQTTAYGTFYSRGSFGVRSKTDYAVRYKFSGSVDVGYNRFRYGWPDTTVRNVASLKWNHVQDPKANPNWTFGAAINFNSNSTNKQTLNVQNDQYFNNTLNSDIRLGRKFGSKPFSADLKLSMRQNATTKLVDLTAPVANFQTTTRIFPFKTINKIVGFTYAGEIQNRSSFKDRYLRNQSFDSIGQQFRSGANQRFNLQATISLFKGAIRLTPSANYTQFYNFQTIQKQVDTTTNTLHIDTLNKGGFSHSFTSSASLTTTLYSYYRFIGKRKSLLRHILTPTVSFNYSPALQTGNASYVDTFQVVHTYNKFENSIYTESFGKNTGKIAFSANNSFELKQKNDKDTLTGFKKTRIIDNLYLSTDYDIFKDSLNWSDLAMRLIINPVKSFNITINANHSWYSWNDTTGKTLNTFAHQTGQGIGRIKSGSIATTWTLTSRENRDKVQQAKSQLANNWNPQYQQWLISPTDLILFDIPWKLSFEHILSINLNTSASYSHQHYNATNTLKIAGDVAISQNWRIASTLLLDASTGKVTNLNLNLFRNIHCWNVTFNWTPIGTNKNFSIGLKGTASVLQNANINIRRPPIVL